MLKSAYLIVLYIAKGLMMKFSSYLKLCRERFSITQEELVEKLYAEHELLSGLDIGTLSRWERDITSPTVERQQCVLRTLQQYGQKPFPAFDLIDIQELEEKVSVQGIQKIIGKHKRFILDFPMDMLDEESMKITNIQHVESPEYFIKITHSFYEKITNNYSNINISQLESWLLHPHNLFLLASYKKQFFGMFISLRLRPEVFEKLMNFEMTESEIRESDFAALTEDACHYPLSYFTYTEQSASLLMLHYYIHLLEYQDTVKEVGSLPKVEDGKRLSQALGLTTHDSDGTLQTFRAPIHDVLTNKYLLTVIFKEKK